MADKDDKLDLILSKIMDIERAVIDMEVRFNSRFDVMDLKFGLLENNLSDFRKDVSRQFDILINDRIDFIERRQE